jgi:hypothetical protein
MNTFDRVELNEEQQAAAEEIRQGYAALETLILARVPGCRLRSVALTELEGSAMWAQKAIAREGAIG